ncbi:unnamed protein product [Lasius platythorax]|uniref:Uncharacterized protein n=1 Tax=Lasius platythorax TaxID=488582 RepID=A0AAV2MZU8_9HYME
MPPYQIRGVRERLKDLTRSLNRINVPTISLLRPQACLLYITCADWHSSLQQCHPDVLKKSMVILEETQSL